MHRSTPQSGVAAERTDSDAVEAAAQCVEAQLQRVEVSWRGEREVRLRAEAAAAAAEERGVAAEQLAGRLRHELHRAHAVAARCAAELTTMHAANEACASVWDGVSKGRFGLSSYICM